MIFYIYFKSKGSLLDPFTTSLYMKHLKVFFTASYTFALISVIADDHDDSEDAT